jgi:hypothetical protein
MKSGSISTGAANMEGHSSNIDLNYEYLRQKQRVYVNLFDAYEARAPAR